MRHIKIVVEYDGTDFHGFQRQRGDRTVQEELEKAASHVMQEPTTIVAAGRTDAGVHARGQVCVFRTRNRIPIARVPVALNSVLPRDVGVKSAEEVPATFHPRYDAVSRVYRYTIDNHRMPSVLLRRFAYHVRERLDVEAMQRAANFLVGTHDFSSFQASGSEMGGSVRHLYAIRVRRRGGIVTITLEANAFLYMMVRNIVGTLIPVGRGDLTPEDVKRILDARDRSHAGPTAPPQGLCLVKVKY
ncbi:MAG: tRNA pseudouridine(38-40) synthase TruA [Abditibacteriales bacterium]|nr:tRNA pseudouridine(38-40) synthase TruA [Abditibacteriales bacterium]MDW8367944.1 tRNA pseudouridine(38-40) synthase TruA [Abditibacteriales bacterium]